MRSIRNILILLIVLAGVWYVTTRTEGPNIGEIISENQYTTRSDSDLGLEFKYRTGPEGYVLQAAPSSGLSPTPTPTKSLILFQAEDYENYQNPPEGGEGPPVIAIQIFENTKKQFPEVWANENPAYSNINLKMGEISEATIGGADAIRYMADGLYATEIAVITHGENVYVVTGQFLDQDSDLRRDFEPLLNSIRFISKPGQE